MNPYGKDRGKPAYEGDNHNKRRTRQKVKVKRAQRKRARRAHDPELAFELARDIADSFQCVCYADDLPEGTPCPCGGDGRDPKGDPGALNGCWHCQAAAAIPKDVKS